MENIYFYWKHILIECTDLAHISANSMKEGFQNTEINNVI